MDEADVVVAAEGVLSIREERERNGRERLVKETEGGEKVSQVKEEGGKKRRRVTAR